MDAINRAPHRKIPQVPALLLVLAFVAAVIAYSVISQRRYVQNLRLVHAEGAVEDLARLLQQRAKDADDVSPDDAVLALTEGEWSFCGYETDDVILKMTGSPPAYEGTVITVHASDSLGDVTLTVAHAAQGRWEVTRPPLPGWWELWK